MPQYVNSGSTSQALIFLLTHDSTLDLLAAFSAFSLAIRASSLSPHAEINSMQANADE